MKGKSRIEEQLVSIHHVTKTSGNAEQLIVLMGNGDTGSRVKGYVRGAEMAGRKSYPGSPYITTRETGSSTPTNLGGWNMCGKWGCEGDSQGVVGGIGMIGSRRMGQEVSM